jgi:putative addiction module component (TIGR02574 family)
MSDLVLELSQRALSLSPEDRARLAEELLASLHQDRDRELDLAWENEIGSRIAEIESGTAKLIPSEEVFAEIRKLLR